MSRVRLLLSESWASIRQNLSTTVAATMTVLIGMCLLGLFIALGTWVLSWSGHLQDELRVKVNFCTTCCDARMCTKDATKAQEVAVGAALRRDPDVQDVVFVSKGSRDGAALQEDNPSEFAKVIDCCRRTRCRTLRRDDGGGRGHADRRQADLSCPLAGG